MNLVKKKKGYLKVQHKVYIRTNTRNVLLSAQMGERASVVLICIITSQRAHTLKLFCMYDKRFEISKKKLEWRRKQNHRLNNLPKVKIFSTLQVHHLILAFIIHNQIIFVYIHKYIHALYIMNCSKK